MRRTRFSGLSADASRPTLPTVTSVWESGAFGAPQPQGLGLRALGLRVRLGFGVLGLSNLGLRV